jgi:hypothetical protein
VKLRGSSCRFDQTYSVAPIVFPYKLIGRRYEPMVSVGVLIQSSWQPLRLYVDSGAMYSVIRSSFAESIGFDYQQGDRIHLQVGSGSSILVYLNQLEMQIGSERFSAQVGFSPQLKVPFHVMGRVDFFDRFKICFQEHQRLLTFDPILLD